MTNTFTKSQVVTCYDASPPIRPSSGAGGPARLVEQTAVIAVGTNDATTVVYRMVRVPTFAIIKKIEVSLDLAGGTATTFTGNLGLYWSDGGTQNDGTQPNYVGANTAVSDSFFAFHVALAAVNSLTDETFQNASGNSVTDGYYLPSSSFQPLWVALTSGAYQGLNSLNVPKGPADSLWSGTGAVSSTSNNFYQLTQDPGGFLDICFRPSSANNLSAAMNFTLRATYAIGG